MDELKMCRNDKNVTNCYFKRFESLILILNSVTDAEILLYNCCVLCTVAFH